MKYSDEYFITMNYDLCTHTCACMHTHSMDT